MLWRISTLLVTVFWLVMTVLLVRITYYPEGSQFAKVPPAAIFRMFLSHGATSNQFMLYHGDKKVGYGTLTPRRIDAKKRGPADYEMMMAGVVEKGGLDLVDSQINWHVNLTLHGAERWGGVNGRVGLSDIGANLDFNWPEGESLPKFTLHTKSGDMDDRMLRLMMPFMSGPNGIKPPPGMELPAGVKLPAEGAEGAVQLKAREGLLILAGQKRRGYVLELFIMDQQRAKAFFTEAGELAIVEMPDGWRALDPVIYNLVPEIPEPEEKE